MKNIVIVIQIAILILELINKGLEENEIIGIVSSEYDVSNNFIKNLLKIR